MSVYRVMIERQYVIEIDAENKVDAQRVAWNKIIGSPILISERDKYKYRSQTNIGKPEWLRKSEENEDDS